MAFYDNAIFVGIVLIGIAVLFAFIPEIRERLPRRRSRQQHHLVRQDPDDPLPPSRPDLKRDEAAPATEPPTDARD